MFKLLKFIACSAIVIIACIKLCLGQTEEAITTAIIALAEIQLAAYGDTF